jgi:DNA polymerase-3 subunit chi
LEQAVSTGVEFHTGVPDTLDFACRLLRKAYRQGATVLCLVPGGRLDAVDRALWTFVERDFVPHVRVAGSPERLLRRTPVWLAVQWERSEVPRDVVLSVGGVHPVPDMTVVGTDKPPRVIEVVGGDESEVERGRALWRRYKAAGVAIVHHPFAALRS